MSFLSITPYTSLQDAITQIGSANKTIQLAQSTNLTQNTVIPANVPIHPISPGIIISNGYTLTINGPVVGGPLHQWLSGFAAGAVTFGVGVGSVKEVDAGWFGGYTQATIEAALTGIGTANKMTLLLRPGTWVISSNADWSAYTNVTFKIVPGAMLQIATATTTTIGGPMEAGLYQIFNCVGTGKVIFRNVTEAVPQWFAANVGTGKISTEGFMATGSSIVVLSADNNINGFTSTDVNKSVLVSGTSNNDIVDLWGTIVSVTDSTHAVISLAAPVGGLLNCTVFLWITGQDDVPAIQAAINSTAPCVYMTSGVYMASSANVPITYTRQLREWYGDGPGRTTILASSNNLADRLVEFTDADYLYVHDFVTRGPGINGVYGGHWWFNRLNNENIERVMMERIEVNHTASTEAIYFDTPILCTLNQVKSKLNVGHGLEINNGVSCTINQLYSITNVSTGLKIRNSNDIVINGGATESSGIGVHIKNSNNIQVNGMDAEAQVHRAPDAPASFPTPTVIAGGSLAVGVYYLKMSWIRQYIDAALDLESLPSPSSTPITITAGNQTIQFTIPAKPTDVPNVTRAYIYATQPGGAPGSEVYVDFWNVYDTPRTVTQDSFGYTSVTPPIVAGVGHGFVVEGGIGNAIRESHSRSLGSLSSRHLLVLGSTKMLKVENLYIVQDATPPTYDIELQAGITRVEISSNISSDRVLNNADASEVSLHLNDQRTLQPFAVLSGNVGIGTTNQFGGGIKVVGLANAVTVPTSDPTGGGVIYVENGALKYRGSSGTTTVLGPA